MLHATKLRDLWIICANLSLRVTPGEHNAANRDAFPILDEPTREVVSPRPPRRARLRTAFRDWAGNEARYPRELAEHALAHVIGDKAEQAYRRSDALARRRELMDVWARHCEGGAGENVVAFKRSAEA